MVVHALEREDRLRGVEAHVRLLERAAFPQVAVELAAEQQLEHKVDVPVVVVVVAVVVDVVVVPSDEFDEVDK